MVDVDDKNEWRECIDIGGVRLPTGYFFGASAATGDLSGGCEEVWGINSWVSSQIREQRLDVAAFPCVYGAFSR